MLRRVKLQNPAILKRTDVVPLINGRQDSGAARTNGTGQIKGPTAAGRLWRQLQASLALLGVFQTRCLGSVTERISRGFQGTEKCRSLTFPLVLDDFEGQG